jgi:tRNA threonylcarbamoyladenosine biosynthesis protein TsaB
MILAVDTSSPSGSVAVLRDEKVIGVVSTTTDETFSSRLFRQLDFLLAELKLTHKAFDLFAVNFGPGSFTGLRVGLTSAKGWAEAYSKPVAAISGLEAVAAQSRSSAVLVPVIDARRGELYFGFYRREGDRLVEDGPDRVGTPEEFWSNVRGLGAEHMAAIVTPDSSTSAQIRAAGVTNKGVELVSSVLAPVIGRIAYERAKRGEVVDALALDANYVRRSDAELHWKGHS